ncbi:hypothetical protein TrST_g5681 [Triparma strigata]|uniref:Uncharacterized protein n=1 Tax=Triparma strigata TaxID=1606541 RepID=A0A9W7DTQ7_9STRA|nr:hypothetical protein TrST_g5681 [Triparma strigata]
MTKTYQEDQFEAQASSTEFLTRTLEQVKAEAAESKKEVEQVKADAAESQKALEVLKAKVEQQGLKIEEQGQTIGEQGLKIVEQGQIIGTQGQTIGVQGGKIELLEGEVRGLKDTSSSSSSITVARPSEAVQMGKLSLPGVLFPLLYISAESLRCIMDSTPEDKIDDLGFIERCGNPSKPTWWVSIFLFVSWGLTYVIPPLLTSDRTPTWGDVMNLNMGRIEALQFTLFSTLSVEALVLYALTNEEGKELDNFLEGLMNVMRVNYAILGLIVIYEYVIKPAIFRPTTRSHTSSSVTSQDAVHLPHANNPSNTITAL